MYDQKFRLIHRDLLQIGGQIRQGRRGIQTTTYSMAGSRHRDDFKPIGEMHE